MNGISTINALKAVQSGLALSAPAADQRVMIFNADGTPAGQYQAQRLIQDGATVGLGYGTCSTAAATAAKTVAISNFILIKGGIVSVRFQNGITAAGATLNVSSTGAKPIMIDGVALPAGVVGENTTVTMHYDGTNFNIIAMTSGVSNSDELLVDMGLPSGVKWASRNIDVTQANGFAASPFQYECSFCSWGNTDMHNPVSSSAFQYNWGSENDGPYASTPGAALTASFGLGNDAAHAALGGSWRMPTTEEFVELFANIDYVQADGTTVINASTANKLVTVNGITGIYLKSKINGNLLFFACSGHGIGSSWYNRGSGGNYWSSSLSSATRGRILSFGSGGVNPQNSSSRFYGFAVRPVQ